MERSLAETHGVSMRQRFGHAGEFASAFRNASVEYVPLTKKDAAHSLDIVQLGMVTLQRAAVGPHLSRGVVSTEAVTFMMPLTAVDDVTVNGHTISETSFIYLGGGADVYCSCPTPLEWIAIQAPQRLMEPFLDSIQAEDGMDRRYKATRLALGTAYWLQAGMKSVTDRALLAGPEIAPGVAAALSDQLMDLLSRGGTAMDTDPLAHARVTRNAMRVVRQAEDYVQTNLCRPIQLSEVATSIGTSPRNLHRAFFIVCGLSPHVYFKRHRLGLVRQALSSGRREQVKAVAMSHGFWHLGHFARDYRHLFGESPSVTLTAALHGRAHQVDP